VNVDPHFRRVLEMLLDCETDVDPWGVIHAGATGVYDGQAWVNYRTANALHRRGLVVLDDDLISLSDEGRKVALTGAAA
jgi:hypothetical protein